MLIKRIKTKKYGELAFFVKGHWLHASVNGKETGIVWVWGNNGFSRVSCSYHDDSFDKAVAKAHRKICTGYGTVMKCVLKENVKAEL